jgi:hypothetical protein
VIFTPLRIHIIVKVTPCNPVCGYEDFGGSYCHRLQSGDSTLLLNVVISQTIQCHNPEEYHNSKI